MWLRENKAPEIDSVARNSGNAAEMTSRKEQHTIQSSEVHHVLQKQEEALKEIVSFLS